MDRALIQQTMDSNMREAIPGELDMAMALYIIKATCLAIKAS
jgi:hypothetical protein